MPPSTSTDPTALLSPSLLAQLERMELVSRKIFRGRMKGERRSRRKSVEFADFRNYVAGDDLRFIDWNTYARLDKLFLKLFLEEEDLHFYSLIDVSPSMNFGSPTKLHYAKQLAAALGYIGLCRADRVKVEALDGSKTNSAPVLRGRKSLFRLTEYVQSIQADDGSTTLTEAVKAFCLRNSGKGILVLITDLMDKSGYEEALKYLVARDLDIYLIHVLAEISVSRRLIDRYKQTLASFIEEARDFSAKRGIAYTMTSTERSVERLVSKYLRQRGLVR